ncbi:hypothetical protein BC940DRAFT_303068 [Gongronella butleri]|nr:hypothetical protein BC940DRAFT_303068 [Gongronella butleri]
MQPMGKHTQTETLTGLGDEMQGDKTGIVNWQCASSCCLKRARRRVSRHGNVFNRRKKKWKVPGLTSCTLTKELFFLILKFFYFLNIIIKMYDLKTDYKLFKSIDCGNYTIIDVQIVKVHLGHVVLVTGNYVKQRKN